MRDELHLMELVDRYLDGGMSDAERSAFAERMRGSAELNAVVMEQVALREGLQRSHLRQAARAAHRHWWWRRYAPAAAAVVLVLGMGTWALWPAGERGEGRERTVAPHAPAHAAEASDTPASDPLVEPVDVGTRVESVFSAIRNAPAEMDSVCEPADHSGVSARADGPSVEETYPAVQTQGAENRSTVKHGAEDRAGSDSTVTARPVVDPKPLLATVEVPKNATVQPTFPGGVEAMHAFIREQLKRPRGAKRTGKVMVSFTVNRKGEVVNAEVAQSLSPAFDAEALRVIRRMPQWSPCRVDDRPVKSKVTVPVWFGRELPATK